MLAKFLKHALFWSVVLSCALLTRCRLMHVFVSSHLARKVNGRVEGMRTDGQRGGGGDITNVCY